MAIYTLASPNRRLLLDLILEEGILAYRVSENGAPVICTAPLGLVTNQCDFTNGLTVERADYGQIDETYSLPAFKKSLCINRANTLSLILKKDGQRMTAEARAYDAGAAVRLILSGEGETTILREATAYRIPETAKNIYAQRLLFSYEDNYHPIPEAELPQNRYAFPMLIECSQNRWALYAEALVYGGDYGGGNLRSTPGDPRLMTVEKAPDSLDPICGKRPLATPWRAVITGTLADITESNLLENLNPPAEGDFSFVKAGTCAWSWMVEHDSASNPARVRDFIDYAGRQGYPYMLIDGGWPGHVDIPEMVRYAAKQNVRIWIWEHSGEMADPKTAEEKMKRWADWGVVGIKIDFFESDTQRMIKRHNMLAELGKKHRLMLNFHGCSKPTGTSRIWPHVMTYEGVLGGEYLDQFSGFLPAGPDAAHNCTLPFTRNAVGPMDYTPLIFQSYKTGTTDTHQLALTVIFTSYIQHLAEKPEAVNAHPCAPFLREIPADWDETRLLGGAPANFVTMARRKGAIWFLGSICARRPRVEQIHLDFLENETYILQIYRDDISGDLPFDQAYGALPLSNKDCETIAAYTMRPSLHTHDLHAVKTETKQIKKGDVLTVPLSVNGGFAAILKPMDK